MQSVQSQLEGVSLSSPSASTNGLSNGDHKPGVLQEPVKLFVGQIPRSYFEKELQPIFSEFGTIVDLKVLKDRVTDHHKGCCFLTYENKDSADKAIKALHDVRQLPGMARPLQVKPADNNETKPEERKLFIGMLSKNSVEKDVREILCPYGTVEECNVLRDDKGVSKSCAFARMGSKEECLSAIKGLHNARTMVGASSPIVIKFADSERERTARRLHRNMISFGMMNPLALAAVNGGHGAMAAYAHQIAQSMLFQPNPFSGGHAQALGGPSNDQLLAQYSAPGAGAGVVPNLALYQNLLARQGIPNPTAFQHQQEGPDGCNLFIYHIPAEYRDADLMQLFSNFGVILSARVFIDKQTNQSKCFGFVSFDNRQSATLAISSMNGFPIGTKRLKVSLKQARERRY
eukprot:scpid64336/ scgid20582/ CUGBP Elav-like family member 6; Bruno-like protein 6; CUG-BP- and ETR-3-like factor 6; RNA-binding protein BRUNOL-6